MSLAARTSQAMRPIVTAFWLGYLLVRACLAIALGVAVGRTLFHGPYALGLGGAMAFAIGVGVIVSYIAMPTSLGGISLHWGVVEFLRLPIAALALIAAVGARLGLERVAIAHYEHFEFLAAHPASWRVPLSLLAGILASATVVGFLSAPHKPRVFDGPNPDEWVLRGGRRTTYAVVRARYAAMSNGAPWIWWGLARLPLSLARLGLRVIGSSGTGKTIMLTLVLVSFLRYVARLDGKYRAYVLDVTNDYRMIISALYKDPRAINAYFLHPGDRDSHCWDLAADVTKPLAMEVTKALFPSRPGTDPFWEGQIRLIGAGMFNGFIEKRGADFTFADWLEQMATHESIREGLLWDEGNLINTQALRELAKVTDDRLRDSLFATIVERCSEYHAIAAGMREQYVRGHRFSLRKSSTESCVAVFGWDKDRDAQMQALHAAYFAVKRRTILATATEDGAQLVMLDELASAGPIGVDLGVLAREGRHVNAITLVAYHSRPALNLALGEKEAAAAIAEQAFVGVLRCHDDETAGDASKSLGEAEIEREVESTTTQNAPGTETHGNQSTNKGPVRESKPIISAGQIKALPLINPDGEQGPVMFVKDDEGSVYDVHYPMEAVRREVPRPRRFRPTPFDNPDAMVLRAPPAPVVPEAPPKPKPRSLADRLKDLESGGTAGA